MTRCMRIPCSPEHSGMCMSPFFSFFLFETFSFSFSPEQGYISEDVLPPTDEFRYMLPGTYEIPFSAKIPEVLNRKEETNKDAHIFFF